MSPTASPIRFLCAAVCLTLGFIAFPGCQPDMMLLRKSATVTPVQDDSFLLSGRLANSETVVLEVFIVRCPFNDEELNTTLWKDVDEQIFSASLRRELAVNGFRAGVIGNQLPSSFLRILKTRDDVDPSQIVTTIRLDELTNQTVMRKTIASRNGQKNEVNVSNVKKQSTILFNENGALGGETFNDGQAVMVIRTQTRGDGSVTLDLLPEVQHGQPRQTFQYDAGSVTMATARPKRAFDSLRSEITVQPGQFVVMTSRPEMSGNVGSFFFTDEEAESGTEQKLLCFRVSYTQHNDMYTEDGSLPMDPSDSGLEVEKANEKDAKEETESSEE
ncbi:MAG: hypothetical protein Q4A17_00190 [Thermoguttaceae bacterium]|nr:hypothetical protein [Thermoguttaceae bacterium]MDO4856346.1 hypothetical protein [Thermoguttaceae bacterium]